MAKDGLKGLGQYMAYISLGDLALYVPAVLFRIISLHSFQQMKSPVFVLT
jgi:hypothetical protein